MRVLIAIVVIIVLMALAGWIVFDFSGNSASVEVRTDEIQHDTQAIVDKSKEILERP